jgi:hypothetical protein
VVGALKPLLDAEPDVQIYQAAAWLLAGRAVDVGGSAVPVAHKIGA